MPTTSLSINGVPYTNTRAFLDAWNAMRERDFDRVFADLTEWSVFTDGEYDDRYDDLPFTQSVSWLWSVPSGDYEDSRKCWRKPSADKWHNHANGKDNFRSKRKAVK